MNHVATFYRFVAIEAIEPLKRSIEQRCRELELRGSVLIATEGINGTLAGDKDALGTFVAELAADGRFHAMRVAWSTTTRRPFRRLKVKERREIVTFGQPGVDPTRDSGAHLDAAAWNRLLDDPDVLLLDVRNRYEIAVGTFPGAVDPGTRSFKEFPVFAESLDDDRQRPIAMFCTGGVRCEKASAYLKQRGFERVFQLDGGILRYLETVGANDRFEGECFLFDHRVAVDGTLTDGSFEFCHACRQPVSVADRESALYREGESCPRCHDALTDEQRARFAERRRQVRLAAARQQRTG